MESNELYHHGVKGQRWGVRRYQNKYGALTKAGKKHRAKLESDYGEVSKIGALSNKGKKRKAKIESDYKSLTGKSVRTAVKAKQEASRSVEKPKTTKKAIRDMTDEELRATVTRLNLERQYRDLNPQKISTGQKFVNKLTKDVITPAATDVGRRVAQALFTKAANQTLGLSLSSGKKKK